MKPCEMADQNTETLKLPDIQAASNPTQLTLVAPAASSVGNQPSPTQQELKQGNASSSASAIPTSNLVRIDLQTQAQSLAQQPGLGLSASLLNTNDVDWPKDRTRRRTGITSMPDRRRKGRRCRDCGGDCDLGCGVWR